MDSLNGLNSLIREEKSSCGTKICKEADQPLVQTEPSHNEVIRSRQSHEFVLKDKPQMEEYEIPLTLRTSTNIKTNTVQTSKSKNKRSSVNTLISEANELQPHSVARLRYRRHAVGEVELKTNIKMLYDVVRERHLRELYKF